MHTLSRGAKTCTTNSILFIFLGTREQNLRRCSFTMQHPRIVVSELLCLFLSTRLKISTRATPFQAPHRLLRFSPFTFLLMRGCKRQPQFYHYRITLQPP